MQHHIHPPGTPRPNGYSHAVSFSGATVMVSGQVPLDDEGRLVGAGDALEQSRQVFRNMRAVLAAAGASMADVAKLTIFLTDMGDLGAFREARDEVFDAAAPPASSLVRVAGLVSPEFRIEVEAVAVLPAR
ncbi:RidA family protein [Actinoplanes sp. TBRC 11911]|uniref:RidA family protein n=1 Tax=Actinoplanes sp. TBRC 11911 TaxID=2729386 RepID=UPI00145C7159|nr:RidA family protein [Actinoplanes sp. TBRC 11911]NMO50478.1 RidA family protein [Actinoplanes sp. TBRC 11911]